MAKLVNNETTQRAELHRKIWAIADNVRGAVDGWDFIYIRDFILSFYL